MYTNSYTNLPVIYKDLCSVIEDLIWDSSVNRRDLEIYACLYKNKDSFPDNEAAR